MERWLEYSTSTLDAFEGVAPPTTIEHLEDAIQVSSDANLLLWYSNWRHVLQTDCLVSMLEGKEGISAHSLLNARRMAKLSAC